MLELPAPRRAVHRLLLGGLAALCMVGFTAPLARAAEPTIAYEKESLGQWEKQLAAGEIKEVTINKRLRSLRTALKDGRYVLARYGPKQEATYAGKLKAKAVPVTVLTPTEASTEAKAKPAHHKLRYIAAGVLVAIVIIVGGVLFVNRRRKALQD